MKRAFTLAEVLITIGVIGIVAALVGPTLVTEVQLRVQNKTAEVFERKFQEALKVMSTQQVLAGYNSTEDFVNELGKHFKILKTCTGSEVLSCFEDTIYDGENEYDPKEIEIPSANVRTSAGLGQRDWGTNVVGIQFANGVFGLIAYNKKCKADAYSNLSTGANCYAMVYDISGHEEPNTLHKDVRYTPNVRKIGNYNTCKSFSDEACIGKPFKPEPISATECEEMKQAGMMPQGVTCLDHDYWGGAVKACEGFNNMADNADFSVIVKKIYNHETGLGELLEGANYNPDVALSFGFPAHGFAVWRKSSPWRGHSSGYPEDQNEYEWGPIVMFYTSYFKNSGWGYSRTGSSSTYAICKGDYGPE